MSSAPKGTYLDRHIDLMPCPKRAQMKWHEASFVGSPWHEQAGQSAYQSAGQLLGLHCQQHRIPHNVGAAYAHANGSLEPTVIPGATPCWDRRQRAVGDPLVAADARLIRTYKDPVGIIPMFPAILANYLAWEIFAFCWVPRRFAAVPSRHRPGSVYREVA
jgi:hypothetical protein